ncbi:MAG: radical SAM/SPASM domain-containing protein [Candidatus Nanoarchaeia archaeon]
MIKHRRYHKARQQAWRNPLPKEIAIELTPLCNQDCDFCFNRRSFFKDTRHISQLTTEQVKQVIDDMARLGILDVRFTGGEPLMRKDCIELMRYAKLKGLSVMLNTNATLVATEERAKQIAEHVDSLLVSLITHDPEKEDKITKIKNSMHLRLHGLDLLAKQGIASIRMGTITTPENIEHFEDLLKIVKEHNVQTWELFRSVGTPDEIHSISKEQAQDLVNKILKHDGNGVDIRITTAIPFCVANADDVAKIAVGGLFDDGHVRMIIDPRGFVKPSYPNDTNLGSPFDLLAAWEHPFQKSMHNEEFLPERCKPCKFKNRCKGGNRYIANLTNGSFNSEDPLMNGPV